MIKTITTPIATGMTAELRLSYIPNHQVPRVQIRESKNAVDYLRQVWSDNLNYLETFYIVHMDRSNHTTGWTMISQGGMHGTLVDIKVVCQHAVKSGCCAILLAHNHPSGNKLASREDIAITKKIVEACKNLEIKVFDHVILTEESYYSLVDEGHM